MSAHTGAPTASDDLKAQVLARTDLADLVRSYGVELERDGPRLKGLCPFQTENSPSFKVFPNNRFHCFGCGAHGNAVDFTMRRDNLGFKEALYKLAGRLGIPHATNANGHANGTNGYHRGGRSIIPPRNGAIVQHPDGKTNASDSTNTGSTVSGTEKDDPALTTCTLQQYADCKGLPLDFLRQLDLSDHNYVGKPAVRIPYYGPDGSVVATRFRTALKKADGQDNRFRWRSGDKPKLYGLNRLEEARKAGRVTIVEGESDAQTLWLHGEPALGLPGADTWLGERGIEVEELPDHSVPSASAAKRASKPARAKVQAQAQQATFSWEVMK